MLDIMEVVLGQPLDLEDLTATPDDGNRYESSTVRS